MIPSEHEWLEGLDEQSMEDAFEEARLDDEAQGEAEFFPLANPDGSVPDEAFGGGWL